jgi:hypothetical protein
MKMKKLFTMLVASVCCSMAFAATSPTTISVSNVTILKGGTTRQMEVTINATGNTAFQFDLTLPKGVSVTKATLGSIESNKTAAANQTRQLRHKLFDSNANKYRFLSYDNGNAALTDTKVLITLEAAATATVGNNIDVAGSDVLAVKINNGTITPSTQANGNVAKISVVDGAEIEIPWGGKTTFVCDKDLDFSSMTNTNAYIVTGYDLTDYSIWLTRVTDVPANTPIWVSGPKGENSNSPATTVIIPKGTSTTYYPQNLLIGKATGSNDVPAETDEYLNWTLGKDGSVSKRVDGIQGFPAGKAYLHLAKNINSVVGDAQTIELNATGNKRAFVTSYDLDFTNVNGLKAYTITGYSKDGTMWLSRVMKASANTPLYLKGGDRSYSDIPSTETKMQLVNMLKGDATNTSSVKVNDGTYTTYVLSKQDGEFSILASDNDAFPAGTAYLPVPNSHLVAASRGEGIFNSKEVEAEVIKVRLMGLEGDGEITGISRVVPEAAVGNDAWYNLSGQRISTPTKKGLYIRNGKKVIVK